MITTITHAKMFDKLKNNISLLASKTRITNINRVTERGRAGKNERERKIDGFIYTPNFLIFVTL